MDIQATKIELVKLLLETNEVRLLEKVKNILKKEQNEDYELTPEQTSILEERIAKYEKGELEFSTWESIEKRLND